MRSALFALRAAGAATVLVPLAVLAPAAGTAHAGDGEERAKVTALVVPATTKPGGDVDIRVHGCEGKHGSVRSKAFVADAELSGREGKGNPLYGDTTVKSHLDSGTYPLTVHCDGRDHHDAGRVHVTHKPPPSPVAPVKAGGGGAALAAEAPPKGGSTEQQGPSTSHTVIGLVLAGVAAVAVALRSTRRRRRTRAD